MLALILFLAFAVAYLLISYRGRSRNYFRRSNRNPQYFKYITFMSKDQYKRYMNMNRNGEDDCFSEEEIEAFELELQKKEPNQELKKV